MEGVKSKYLDPVAVDFMSSSGGPGAFDREKNEEGNYSLLPSYPEESPPTLELQQAPQASPSVQKETRYLSKDARASTGHRMVNISLPTISRWSARIQNVQSSMGKFWDLSLMGLAQSLVSLALLLFFNDEFSKYEKDERVRLGVGKFFLAHVKSRVISLSQASILCGVYTCFDSVLLVLTKSSKASVFEVIVPLVFGVFTILLAMHTFFSYRREPGEFYMTIGFDVEEKPFLMIISLFLFVWFCYFRVGPLLRLCKH